MGFHSCRVAYVTFVLEAGASVSEAQTRARHAQRAPFPRCRTRQTVAPEHNGRQRKLHLTQAAMVTVMRTRVRFPPPPPMILGVVRAPIESSAPQVGHRQSAHNSSGINPKRVLARHRRVYFRSNSFRSLTCAMRLKSSSALSKRQLFLMAAVAIWQSTVDVVRPFAAHRR